MEQSEEEFTTYVSGRLEWLLRVAYLLCQDFDRADDLVQTAITRLFLNWRRAVAVDNLDGYARTILIRVYLTEQRAGWWRRVQVVPELPETAIRDHEGDLDLRRALASLPPRQRATIVLRFYCDLNVEQTAEVMRCSTGNVKSQTARGIAALRRILEPALLNGEA